MTTRIALAFVALLSAAPAWAQDGTAVPEGSHVTLFALGLILHECLCGVRPHRGTLDEVLRLRRTQAIPRPVELVGDGLGGAGVREHWGGRD